MIRDPNTSLGKGIAYVLFKTRVCLPILLNLLFLGHLILAFDPLQFNLYFLFL